MRRESEGRELNYALDFIFCRLLRLKPQAQTTLTTAVLLAKKKKRNDIKKTNNKYYEKEEAVKKSHNNKCWRQSRRRGLLNVAINRLSALDRRGKWL